jgi:hypothetical protein
VPSSAPSAERVTELRSVPIIQFGVDETLGAVPETAPTCRTAIVAGDEQLRSPLSSAIGRRTGERRGTRASPIRLAALPSTALSDLVRSAWIGRPGRAFGVATPRCARGSVARR